MAFELDFSKEHLRTEEAVTLLLCLLVHGGESRTALTLREKGLLRSIPPELARCAQLEVLNLGQCGLEGELPPPAGLTLASLDAALEEGRVALAELRRQHDDAMTTLRREADERETAASAYLDSERRRLEQERDELLAKAASEADKRHATMVEAFEAFDFTHVAAHVWQHVFEKVMRSPVKRAHKPYGAVCA